MPVGTLGAVKGATPGMLRGLGAEIFLANLYHLALRPGIEVIEDLGGLHAFTGWHRPILTDSGGFQVYSLSGLREIDDGGVTFRSHLDGSIERFTPEAVVEWQQRIGVDIAMMLDECPPWPCPESAVESALERTNEWAVKARDAWRPERGALFGIVQGGVFERLRERAVEALLPLEFSGYAIGGVSVGEPIPDRRRVVEVTAPMLPGDKPRYLMGVGTPLDILHAVQQGVDLFDCVLPTRNARHGVLYTRNGPLRIRNAGFRRDPRPVEDGCDCPCCREVPRALLHHLVRAGEVTGTVLATAHNVRFFLDFMMQLREAIASGRTGSWAADFVRRYGAADRTAAADQS
jgi:queuine tRNA-ribosyltransferase